MVLIKSLRQQLYMSLALEIKKKKHQWMTKCLSALFLSVHFKSGTSSITRFAVHFYLVLFIESFNSSWWIYYRDKMLFLFSSGQEKFYIFANISHYLLVIIFKLIVWLSLFASSLTYHFNWPSALSTLGQ